MDAPFYVTASLHSRAYHSMYKQNATGYKVLIGHGQHLDNTFGCFLESLGYHTFPYGCLLNWYGSGDKRNRVFYR